MKSILLLLPFAIAALFGGHIEVAAQTCDPNIINLPPMQNLNLSRLVNKVWYVQELFVRRPEDVYEPTFECYMQSVENYFEEQYYGITHDTVDLFTDIESGNVTRFVSVANLLDDNTAVWTLGTLFSKQYTITFTATDYNTYGVLHFCPYDDAPQPYEAVMTMTAIPIPSDTLLNSLKGLVAGLGYPTENPVKLRHHADCVYTAADEKAVDNDNEKVIVDVEEDDYYSDANGKLDLDWLQTDIKENDNDDNNVASESAENNGWGGDWAYDQEWK